MNNLEKAISVLSDMLDEMSDTMDIDANGNPDDAMRWATQVSDALVRLKRHAKADTKTGADLCQKGRAGDVVITRNESGAIVAVTRQDADGRILEVIAEAAPPAAEVNQQLLDALELCFEHCKLYHREVVDNNVGVACRAAILAAQSQEEQQ